MDLDLNGRKVLVTGASRGIGRAVAEGFAQEGCDLHLVARNMRTLAEAQEHLVARYGRKVSTLALDVGESGAVEKIASAFPDVDILINNAGAIPRGTVVDLSEKDWRSAWELKVFGYINMTREYYRRMSQRGSGVIINIIGLAAEKLDHLYAAGSTGNAALAAFTRAVGSASLEQGVRVAGIHPGYVDTDRVRNNLRRRAEASTGDPERWRELVAESWPTGRLIEAKEISDMVVFLASDRARSVTGQIITVDAGVGSRGYIKAPAS